MLAMYFERLNSGLPLYETIGRTGMLALCTGMLAGFPKCFSHHTSLIFFDWELQQILHDHALPEHL